MSQSLGHKGDSQVYSVKKPDMQRKGLKPGTITYKEPDMVTHSAMISACEKGKQPDKALTGCMPFSHALIIALRVIMSGSL